MTSRQIYVIGVNYKTTPIDMRAHFSIEIKDYAITLEEINKIEGVLECAILSTCNRTELHVVMSNSLQDGEEIERRFCLLKKLDLYQVKKYFYVYKGVEAIHHIIKVASGMDSMILGEDQILGQFKKAYEISMKQRSTKSVLNTLSRLAITSSKKIKTRNIYLGKARSVAGRAATILLKHFQETLANKTVLMIGAGEIGQLMTRELMKLGVRDIKMTKRNMCQVAESELPMRDVFYVDYLKRYEYIKQSDIIISATTSPHYTITKDCLDLLALNQDKEHFFIDLALPRDIDTSIKEIKGVHLLDMDEMCQFVDKDEKKIKSMDLQFVQEQIDLHTEEFIRWYQKHRVYSLKQEA